jgi:hypothetical protein
VYLAQTETNGLKSQALSASDGLDPEALQPITLQPEQWMLGPMAGRSLIMQHLFARMRSTAPHFRLVQPPPDRLSPA